MNNQKILVIDDEPQIRKLLEINLDSNGYQVVTADHGSEGIRQAASHQPDLVLLDLGLPDLSGHQVLKRLREWYLKPIIILSVINQEEDIVNALDNGASDYLTKPFRTSELMARIRLALRHSENTNNNEPLIRSGNLEIDLNARSVRKNGELIKLTQTEFQLLTILASNPGRVLTHHQILKEIRGTGFQEETQYLRVFVGTLRKKIEDDHTSPHHILTESGVGYRFQ